METDGLSSIPKERAVKRTEANVPEHLRVHVVYLFKGRLSKNQLKKIGKTNTGYVTIAKLFTREGGRLVAEGRASCSQTDNPSRKVGRAVAVGRALTAYHKEPSCLMT